MLDGRIVVVREVDVLAQQGFEAPHLFEQSHELAVCEVISIWRAPCDTWASKSTMPVAEPDWDAQVGVSLGGGERPVGQSAAAAQAEL